MVEWKKLGEVEDSGILTLGRGQVISKIDINDCPGDFPVYSSSSQNSGEIGRYGKYMFDDERITWSIDGGGRLFYRNGIKYSVTNVCGWLKVNNEKLLNTKFLYYLLYEEWTNIIFDYNHKAHPSIIRNEYQIPIISLVEQQRIVGILDTFTASIDNLKEQIAQRRKQYEYYRDQLLDLEGKPGVEMKRFGEVCELVRGVRVVKKDLQREGEIPVYQNSLTPLGFYEKSNYPEDTTFVICAGAAGEVGYSKIAFWAADDCTCIICPSSICSKYVYNYLMVKQYLLKVHVRKASVPRLSKDVIGKLQFPIPSLQEQQRIVSILDTFEASIQNLEAQLKQREKQYEYYRNKLLTFE